MMFTSIESLFLPGETLDFSEACGKYYRRYLDYFIVNGLAVSPAFKYTLIAASHPVV